MNINEIDDRIKALFDDSVKNTQRIQDTDDDFYVYDNQINTSKVYFFTKIFVILKKLPIFV
jgi:hypothetical protein